MLNFIDRVRWSAIKALGGGQRYNRVVNAVGSRAENLWPDLGQFDQQAKAYANSPWVYQAVNLIATTLATIPLSVVRLVGEEEQSIINHPLELLLARPNPWLSSFELMEATFGWLDLVGNMYWFLSGPPGGKPTAIYPLRPDRMRIVPGFTDEEYIRGYVYTVDGLEIPLMADEVVHFKRFNSKDDFYGLSPLEPAGMSIATDFFQAKWNRNFFGKEVGVPTGVVNVKGMPSNDDFDRLKMEWMQSYATDGTRRTAFLRGADLSYQPIGISHLESNFQAGRLLERDIIYQSFGIPPAIYDQGANRSNSDSADDFFAEKCLWPRLVRVSSRITASLLPFWGNDLRAKPMDIRRKDMEAARTELVSHAPYLTLNEVRSMYLKLPPVKEFGDVPTVGGGLSYALALLQQQQSALSPYSPGRQEQTRPEQARNRGAAVLGDVMQAHAQLQAANKAFISMSGERELQQYGRYMLKRWDDVDAVDSFTFLEAPPFAVAAHKAILDVVDDEHMYAALVGDEPLGVGGSVAAGAKELEGVAFSFLQGLGAAWGRLSDISEKKFLAGQISDLTRKLQNLSVPVISQGIEAGVSNLSLSTGVSFDPSSLALLAEGYAREWVSQRVASFVSLTVQGLKAIAVRVTSPVEMRDAVGISPLFGRRRAELFGATEGVRLFEMGRIIGVDGFGRGNGLDVRFDKALADNLMPAHRGCGCHWVEEPEYEEGTGRLIGVNVRWRLGITRKHCSICVNRDGVLYNDLIG